MIAEEYERRRQRKEHREYILIIFGLVIGAFFVSSLIALAAFDFRWWKPLGEFDIGRQMGLGVLHIGGLVYGGISFDKFFNRG